MSVMFWEARVIICDRSSLLSCFPFLWLSEPLDFLEEMDIVSAFCSSPIACKEVIRFNGGAPLERGLRVGGAFDKDASELCDVAGAEGKIESISLSDSESSASSRPGLTPFRPVSILGSGNM